MVRDDGRVKTISWLLVILGVIICFELVMVVKFFTKEFFEYTIEEAGVASKYEEIFWREFEYGDSVKKMRAVNKLGSNESLDRIDQVVSDVANENEIIEEDGSMPTEVVVTNEQERAIKTEVSSRSANTSKVVQNTKPVEEKKVEDNDSNTNVSASSSVSTVSTTSVPADNVKVETVASTYGGYATVGKIEIPKTGVNMPILANQTVGGMEIASCLLYSSGELNYSGKNLITGHNYRNGKLFSNNNKLQIGDKFYITTLDGKRVEYSIYNKVITTPEDVSFLMRDSSDVEVFLSSCSDDNVKRVVIFGRSFAQ